MTKLTQFQLVQQEISSLREGYKEVMSRLDDIKSSSTINNHILNENVLPQIELLHNRITEKFQFMIDENEKVEKVAQENSSQISEWRGALKMSWILGGIFAFVLTAALTVLSIYVSVKL